MTRRFCALNSKPNRLRSTVLLALVLAVLAACRTVPTLPPVDLAQPGWEVQRGQAIWRSSRDAPEIAGELLVATHPDGRALLQFTKTPLPLVVAQITANRWQIEFGGGTKAFSGPGNPPSRLGWLQLARYFAGGPPGARWRCEKSDQGRWKLENKTSGETIEGYLAP